MPTASYAAQPDAVAPQAPRSPAQSPMKPADVPPEISSAAAAKPQPPAAAVEAPRPSVLRTFSIVLAIDSEGGIGKNGALPWRLPQEMAYFVDVTTKVPAVKGDGEKKRNVVIMGRKTWESIPARFRPLKDRLNIVLSRTLDTPPTPDVVVLRDLPSALAYTSSPEVGPRTHSVFVIGGAQLFNESLTTLRHLCRTVYLTRVAHNFECDLFFDTKLLQSYAGEQAAGAGLLGEEMLKEYGLAQPKNEFVLDTSLEAKTDTDGISKTTVSYTCETHVPVNHEERAYLSLVARILHYGIIKGDRTGVGTVSIVGPQLRFSLRDGLFPLLTTKRVFWRGVAEELLWFVRGSTNARLLQDKDIHIWDGNSTKDFLAKRGLGHREEGDLGPVYGFQWRHFGAEYTDMHADYTGKGVDQLQSIIDTLRTNPSDRRILMSAWNPMAIPDMALPPCHVLAQFIVENGALSCVMYQRSADMGLGVPFNIASYALLTCMLAHVTGLRRGEFVHDLGDAHVYSNHVDGMREQVARRARAFPTLTIRRETTNIEEIQFEDLLLFDYKPMEAIKLQMAV